MNDEEKGREVTDTLKDKVENVVQQDSESIKSNGWKHGYVNKYHLIYLLTIAGIILVLLLSLLFQDSIYAGAMLSFAATLSSILLAVIAIIITLLDVAGHRNNILDVKNSVEDLKKVRKEIFELIQNFEEKNKKSSEVVISALDIFRESNKEDIENAISKIREIKTNNSDPAEEKKIKDAQRNLEKALGRLDFTRPAISDERKREIISNMYKSMNDYDFNFQPKNKDEKNN